LGDRKAIQATKNATSKPIGMTVNKSEQGAKNLVKSYGDAQDKDDWRLRIKGHLANAG